MSSDIKTASTATVTVTVRDGERVVAEISRDIDSRALQHFIIAALRQGYSVHLEVSK